MHTPMTFSFSTQRATGGQSRASSAPPVAATAGGRMAARWPTEAGRGQLGAAFAYPWSS